MITKKIENDQNLIVLAVYWLVASSSLIWGRPSAVSPSWVTAVPAVLIIAFATILLVATTHLLHSRPLLVIVVPTFSALATALLCLSLLHKWSLRSVFCAFFIPFFVATFNAVLFSENASRMSSLARTLVHRRYIEYLRSFLWVVTFVLVGYLSWEITFRTTFSTPKNSSPMVGFFQLVCVFLGVPLCVYAFHIRFTQIEGSRSNKIKPPV